MKDSIEILLFGEMKYYHHAAKHMYKKLLENQPAKGNNIKNLKNWIGKS